jgi:hypothetical protein
MAAISVALSDAVPMSLSILLHTISTMLLSVFIISIGAAFLIIAVLTAEIMWAMYMEDVHPSVRKILSRLNRRLGRLTSQS